MQAGDFGLLNSFIQLMLTLLFPNTLPPTNSTTTITTTTLPYIPFNGTTYVPTHFTDMTTPSASTIAPPKPPGSDSCIYEPSFSYMNTKTDYELVANTRPESDDFTMPGCDPIGIWHLSRHGARYPDTTDINEINNILSQAKDQILSTGKQ